MRRSLLAVLVIVAGWATAHASKPSPLPTVDNLTGAWVAAGSWGNQYRLVLDSDGKGSIGEIGLHDEPFLVDVLALTIDRYRIEMSAASREKDWERYVLKGDATARSFTLRCKALLGNSEVTFYRESEWQHAATKLAAAMSKATD